MVMKSLFVLVTGAIGVFFVATLGPTLRQGQIPIPGIPQCSEASTSGEDSRCTPQKSRIVQIAVHSNTVEIAGVTEDFTHEIFKKVNGKDWLDISIATNATNKDQRIQVLYSGFAAKQVRDEIYEDMDSDKSTVFLDPMNSDEFALVETIQRFKERVEELSTNQELYFYWVTSGTSNPEVIYQVEEILKSIEVEEMENVSIYLIGLEEHRLNFVSAFNPISSHTLSASSKYDEWIQLVRKL